VIESFNFAIEGVIHVLRTQRNMRLHFAAAVAVIVVDSRSRSLENRAEPLAGLDRVRPGRRDDQHRVEGAIDAATTSFDPMAKLAKESLRVLC